MNGHSNINTIEATEHLKNILNLNVEKAEPRAAQAELNSKHDSPNSELGTPTSKLNIKMDASRSTFNYRNENVFQQVELSGDDTNVAIYGTDVTVYSSPLHRSPSLKIMIDNVVDYGWDQKYYIGRLLSLHRSMKYLAYSLKSPVSQAGFARVMKLGSKGNVLLRGFKGRVKDLAFAYITSPIILGCIDDMGQLFIFEITDNMDVLDSKQLLTIANRNEPSSSIYNRIIWCPYIPDHTVLEDDDDSSLLLCATRNELVEIWNISYAIKEYGNALYSEDVKTDIVWNVSLHTQPITASAFSPDAIAFATASLDGYVKFHEVIPKQVKQTPKFLHQWMPHNGKPLSSLFFLDNMKNPSPDAEFWRFAVTGAENNQELKLWCCKRWVCLQTISFKPNQVDASLPCLQADMDLSGRHIFLSDISRKVLYVLRAKQETDCGQVFVCSLSEFPVKFSVLGMAVMYVTQQRAKSATVPKSSCDNEEEEDADKEDDEDDSDDTMSGNLRQKPALDYLIRLYWIHTKSLQKCRIIYSVMNESPMQSVSSVGSSQDSFAVYRDSLSELITEEPTTVNIMEQTDASRPSSNEINKVITTPSSTAVTSMSSYHTNYSECDNILLTPKDFTSPAQPDLPSVNISTSFTLAIVDEVGSDVETTMLASKQDVSSIQAVSPDINPCSRRKSLQHSASSSPSREVAEILSPRQLLHQGDNVTSNEEKEAELLPNNDTDVGGSPSSRPLQGKDWPSPPNSSPSSQPYQEHNWPSPPASPAQEYKAAVRNENEIHLTESGEKHEKTCHTLPSLDPNSSSEIMQDLSFLQLPYLRRLEQSVDSISHQLTTVTDTVHRQNQAIQYIRNEMQELHQQQKFIQDDIQSFGTMDTNISTKLEKLLSASTASEYARIESLFNKKDVSDKQRIEQQSTVLSQQLLAFVTSQLEQLIKQEMKNTVAPQISSSFDSFSVCVRDNLLLKLSATDNVVRECVGRYLKSKAFLDNIAQAAQTQFQQTVQMVCKETFQTSVIPAFDKSCHMLIGQMNEVFVNGTTEYVQQLEQQRKSTCDNFEASVNRLQDQLKKLTLMVDGIHEKQFKHLEQNSVENAKQSEFLIMKIKETVHGEVQRALKEQASSFAAIASRAATPVESTPNPSQLLRLVKQGEINEAFNQALCSYDLDLLIFLCQSVSLDQVFGPQPCPLDQKVILALINQLSGDFSTKTELKIKYIEDAITSLNVKNQITKANVGIIISTLEKNINSFVQKNPKHVMNRNFRRILLAGKSLLMEID